MYDYLIVGAGFFSAVCAHELKKKGYKVCVIDRRNHVGGNCYTEQRDNIPVFVYDPHTLHTSDREVWDWVNQFSEFNNVEYSPTALTNGKFYPLPVNMWTFYQLHGTGYPIHAINDVINQSGISDPQNFEEQARKKTGNLIYDLLIKNYTKKYWGKDPTSLSKELASQIPVKLTFDNTYHSDLYEGIPVNGYTPLFDQLLEGIDVNLNTDFFNGNLPEYKSLIYTGPLDRYFEYKHGVLEYRGFTYKHKAFSSENHQGTQAMCFVGGQAPYTKIIESKHFYKKTTNNTWVSWEHPIEINNNTTEFMYPINTPETDSTYRLYEQEKTQVKNVYFGGKLADYKQYSTAEIIKSALNLISEIKHIHNLEVEDVKLIKEHSQSYAHLKQISQDNLSDAHLNYLQRLREEFNFVPKVVYDIGACVLNWTNGAKRIWPEAEYILFEAMEESEELFQETEHKYHIGVFSDEDNKEVTFYKNVYCPWGNSYYMENPEFSARASELFEQPQNQFKRKTVTLDTVRRDKNFPYPDLLKIDVQGCEIDILKGAKDILQNVEHLIVELQHVPYNIGAQLQDTSIPFIESLGFELITPRFSENTADADYHFKKRK